MFRADASYCASAFSGIAADKEHGPKDAAGQLEMGRNLSSLCLSGSGRPHPLRRPGILDKNYARC